MNPHTGSIRSFESPEAARRAGHTVPLTDEQAAELLTMRPQDRIGASLGSGIETLRSALEVKARGEPVTAGGMVGKLASMNRHDRRKYAAEQLAARPVSAPRRFKSRR